MCYCCVLHYAVGNLRKAAIAVATFLAREPSHDAMTYNVHYYVSELKLTREEFIPRQVSQYTFDVVSKNLCAFVPSRRCLETYSQ